MVDSGSLVLHSGVIQGNYQVATPEDEIRLFTIEQADPPSDEQRDAQSKKALVMWTETFPLAVRRVREFQQQGMAEEEINQLIRESGIPGATDLESLDEIDFLTHSKDLFEVVRQGDITVVIFASAVQSVDVLRLQKVCRELVEIAESTVPPWMVVDLTAVEYFGSAFVEVLFRAWYRMRFRGNSRFAIGGLQKYCRIVLEITQIDLLMPVFATREDAVAALSSKVVGS